MTRISISFDGVTDNQMLKDFPTERRFEPGDSFYDLLTEGEHLLVTKVDNEIDYISGQIIQLVTLDAFAFKDRFEEIRKELEESTGWKIYHQFHCQL